MMFPSPASGRHHLATGVCASSDSQLINSYVNN